MATNQSKTVHHSAQTRIEADKGNATALIDFKQLSQKVCMGRSRIYALIAKGDFPPPVKIGTSSRWVNPEIEAYISQLAATRDSELTGAA